MKDPRRWWPWALAAGAVAVLLAAITAAAVRFGHDGAAGLVDAVGLLVSVAGGCFAWALRRTRATAPPSGRELDPAAEALASLVRDQWNEEAAARGLLDPGALAVRWRGGQDEWGDYEHVVGGALGGTSAEMAAFARGFRALPHRRLVILGAPGAGKTSLAVLLLRELAEHREPGDPVPVLLALSAWNPQRETLAAWIARRVRQDYPALGNHGVHGRFAVSRLIAERRVLPVLDGLDEMPETLRPHALVAVNRALAGGGALVLTCRSREFHRAVDASDVVTAAAVCHAEPLAADAVTAYLADSASPRRAGAWQPVFTHLREDPDGPLATAFTSPLNVWLARTVYAAPGTDPAELARIGESNLIQDRLLDALVSTAFTGPDAAPGGGEAAARWAPQEARAWLGFLAAHLRHLNTDELAWWHLEQAVEPDPAGPLRAPLVALVFGCGGASLAAPYFTSGYSGTATLGATSVLTTASALAATVVIRAAATLRPSPARTHTRTRLHALTAIAAPALLVAGLAVAVGAVIGRYGIQEQHTFVGRYYQVRATPGMAWHAGLGWAALICSFGTLAALGSTATVRRGRGASRDNHPLIAQAATVLVFGAVFWLGAECLGADVTLPIVQRHGLWRQMRSVSEGANSATALFLLVAGVVAGLRMGGPQAFPGRLDFRLRGRLRHLLRQLPAALARGALLGGVLGIGWALTFPDYPRTPGPATRLAALIPFGLVLGLLSGAGLALVRWARTPADADQATALTTLRGDRRLALAFLLISILPFTATWLLVLATTHLTENRPHGAHRFVLEIVAVPEAGIVTALAAGLLSVSATTYFGYLEARIRLAAAGCLPRRLIQFLEDARLVHVLRQVGGVYQFCHATLQEHLAAQHARDADMQQRAAMPRSRTRPPSMRTAPATALDAVTGSAAMPRPSAGSRPS